MRRILKLPNCERAHRASSAADEVSDLISHNFRTGNAIFHSVQSVNRQIINLRRCDEMFDGKVSIAVTLIDSSICHYLS